MSLFLTKGLRDRLTLMRETGQTMSTFPTTGPAPAYGFCSIQSVSIGIAKTIINVLSNVQTSAMVFVAHVKLRLIQHMTGLPATSSPFPYNYVSKHTCHYEWLNSHFVGQNRPLAFVLA